MPDLDLLAAGDVRRWVDFDVAVRRESGRERRRRWSRERLAVAACHWDGHLREAAVRRLAAPNGPRRCRCC